MVKTKVALYLNDCAKPTGLWLRMAQITEIYQSRRPQRIHYIREWAKKRKLKQRDFIKELKVDKATVSRWFKGQLPETPNLYRIVELLQLEEVNDLFRHPDETWIVRVLQGRSEAELKRLQNMIQNALPERTGTDD